MCLYILTCGKRTVFDIWRELIGTKCSDTRESDFRQTLGVKWELLCVCVGESERANERKEK